ncbi:phosphotransferase [Tropicimonas sediminicola]|uniref:Phosphotransferase enzyme family protein n=1 Tax=Tropicimonas sediminicola TaxID=1031541 RepID=A0A239LEP1_9RHOB|nr:phosphotransferase [Tropicimonas sediminicola]SNT28004.1 Phosphotransferase enzyme family protein [Tropicimonas sediminicola]
MARLPRAIEENLHFLCAELDGQLAGLQAYFEAPETGAAQKVIQRAGYADNLRSRVHNASQRGLSAKKVTDTQRLLLQNMDMVGRNLDLISRLARRSLIHAEDVRLKELLRPEAYPKVIKRVRAAVKLILPAILESDSAEAIRIGQTKARLDDLYDRLFRTYTRDMRKSKHTEDLSNSLLAANEIRRMGDALQGVSEAILSASIGQSVQFERYFTLRSILSDGNGGNEDLELEPIAETRSGSAISAVRSREDRGGAIDAVFKDGELRKVREERAGMKSWHSIYPGLAPKILSYEKRGGSAALLIEHLPGHTFERILLNESEALLRDAQKALSKTLRDIWKSTRTDEPAEMASMRQLSTRMKDVRRIHPEFGPAEKRIGGLDIEGYDDLVARADRRERSLPAPFSVYIHGDFNLDNVIYDPVERKIRFIDLHRSRYMDYVQDVSVFMVSNYRLQVQDGPIRRRIADVTCDFYAMSAKFARSQKDGTFEYRLALGLARSFATSTRFIYDTAHARRMFLRSRFLLELALACPANRVDRFKLPIRELFSD